jgi:putative ABC transport system permease protein
MNRRNLFLSMLLKAAWVRKDRALTALLSVAVVSTIATAALTVYRDLENKLSREFSGFGANVIASARRGALNQEQLQSMQRLLVQKDASLAGKVRIVPVAYVIATAPDGSKIVVGGTEIGEFRELHSWWSVHETGNPRTEVLLGSRAAQALSPKGNGFTVSFGERQAKLDPEIVFTSGSDDDSRIYVDLMEFTALTGVAPQTALLRVEGRPQNIQDAIATLSSSFPEIEVKPVRQITQAQTSVVGKTRSLFLSAFAVVVILIMLCMVATLTSAVMERRKDFAVMKALGAPNRTVSLLFAGEATLLALAGAVAGFAAGSAIAYWIGKANFDAAILPQPALLPPVLLGSVILALLAATAPLRLLRQIQPAGILRGE